MTDIAAAMFVALGGELVLHPTRARNPDPLDAYALFLSRSSAMGWLAEPQLPDARGAWGMNDAWVTSESTDSEDSEVAWFQVTSHSPDADRPIPGQPFLRCVDDVMRAVGVLQLHTVQMLVPVQTMPASTDGAVWARLLQDAEWFADIDSKHRTPIRIVIDCGSDRSFPTAITGMLEWMQQFEQGVATFEALGAAGIEGAIAPHEVLEGNWDQAASNCFTIESTVAEWSLDVIGWIITYIAEAAHQKDVRAPLLVNVTRA